ncbi:monocarboxylate transporter 12-B [Toxorhynchites rutilus septentrionalis]|uniref:monocarboxylate transporter 12-B n=1 Tax=Toxorhynchites rutilus septentrionalis TaxID=329112 RepID=UPI00247ADEDE|nr:monocarboxylate transporter 12-B [Toxorhynchites rutilus septentrionalis]XP_055628262.1 monocarboxylate transporter 12-B [Toxorhynchites rutilus septentrionalis]
MTKVPPDGGFGWLVVAGCAVTNIFNQSLISVFGLMFGDYLSALGENAFGAALVMNMCNISLNFSGLITGPIIKKFGARKAAILGSLLTGGAMTTCSRATQMWQILLSYSMAFGFGLGLIQSSTFVAINSYFRFNKGKAVGFALAGTGIGQILMPLLVQYLLDLYDFRGTTLIIGGLAFNGVVGSLLLQPVEWHMVHNKDEESANETKPLLNGSSNSPKKSNNGWSKLAALMDVAILKKASFLNLIIGLGLAYTASTSFSLFFPYFLQRTANLDMLQAANCMSILSTTDLLTRVTVPAFVDKMNFSHRNTFLLAGLCLVIARAIMAEMRSIVALMITSAFYGIFRSITIVNQNLTIAEYCSERSLEAMLPNALGFNMITKGILVLSLGQVLGWFVDYSGSYSMNLHAQNLLLVSTCVLWLCEMYFKGGS